MSVRILCDTCNGWREVGHGTGEDTRVCPTCWDEATRKSLGYIEKGCENCKLVNSCMRTVVESWGMQYSRDITFCTAWEKKDE